MNEPAEPRDVLIERFRREYGLEQLDPADLDLALTHSSYAYEENLEADNERLEFLGDSVLAAIASDYLYENRPDADEGALSKLRARLVSRTVLGRRAREMGLGELVLLGRGERNSGGSRRRSLIGSALEAVIGILYEKKGYEPTRLFVRAHILEPLIQSVAEEPAHGDFKSALQEWCQRERGCVPTYRRLSASGPDHARAFTVEVLIEDEPLATATAPRIKQAENEAARKALETINPK